MELQIADEWFYKYFRSREMITPADLRLASSELPLASANLPLASANLRLASANLPLASASGESGKRELALAKDFG